MLTEVAFVVVQLRRVGVPTGTLLGLALNATVGAGVLPGVGTGVGVGTGPGVGPGTEVVTVTTVEDLAVPPDPVAVNVYVVVTAGVTFCEPLAGNVPTPLMVTEFALLVLQLSTVDAPLATVPG